MMVVAVVLLRALGWFFCCAILQVINFLSVAGTVVWLWPDASFWLAPGRFRFHHHGRHERQRSQIDSCIHPRKLDVQRSYV